MTRRWLAGVALLGVSALLGGCGADENKDGTASKQIVAAQAATGKWQDWETVSLHNGLVTVQAVPQLGGRLMAFTFADRNLLYNNPKLLGHVPGEAAASRDTAGPKPATGTTNTPGEAKPGTQPVDPNALPGNQPPRPTTPKPSSVATNVSHGDYRFAANEKPDPDTLKFVPSPTSQDYANYGGGVAWPLPQSHWRAPWPPPLALDHGTYVSRVETEKGDECSVTLVSPQDEALGLELRRSLTLYRGSTVLKVGTELHNVGKESRLWAVQDLSEHPGAIDSGETYNHDLQLLLPLNTKSAFQAGFATLLGEPREEQVKAENGILTVSYRGQEMLLGSDQHDGWVAYWDKAHQTALVKYTLPPTDATYPENNVSATVYAAPSKRESYLAMALRSPLATVAPDARLTFDVWYAAARCTAPIKSASAVGFVTTPLSGERALQTATLTGVFGVFYSGFAQVVFLDKAGRELSRTSPINVSPDLEFHLNVPAALPEGTEQASVVLLNSARVQMGELASCTIKELRTRTAEELAAHPTPAPAPSTPSTPAVTPATPDAAATSLPQRNPMPSAVEVPAKAPHKPDNLPEPKTAGP